VEVTFVVVLRTPRAVCEPVEDGNSLPPARRLPVLLVPGPVTRGERRALVVDARGVVGVAVGSGRFNPRSVIAPDAVAVRAF
jgi:hypothetical protein